MFNTSECNYFQYKDFRKIEKGRIYIAHVRFQIGVTSNLTVVSKVWTAS